MASVNQTRPHCVNQMGKTYSKPLAARHGRGTAWARHGHGMLCVNRPLEYEYLIKKLPVPTKRATIILIKVKSRTTLLRLLPLYIGSYQKSFLKYKL